MVDLSNRSSIVCPLRDASYFESAVAMIFEAGYDASLPWAERLYKLAAASVGFGLRIGCDYPEELEGLLAAIDSSEAISSQISGDARSFVVSFVSAAEQDGLLESVCLVGAPVLAVLVLLLVKHVLGSEQSGLRDGSSIAALEMTRTFLCSVLLLARENAKLTRRFRDLVPG